MSLIDIIDARIDFDFDDYPDPLAEEIDQHIENNEWLGNDKQPYYVVKTVELTLKKSHLVDIGDRRLNAQKEVLDEAPIKDLQTVQRHCGKNLFEGYESPPNKVNDPKWHVLFDRVLEDIERDRRS